MEGMTHTKQVFRYRLLSQTLLCNAAGLFRLGENAAENRTVCEG